MNGVGFVQSVRNQDKKAGGFFQVAMVQMDGMENAYNMAYFGDSDIHSTISQRIEVEWEELPKGQYINRTIKTFKVLPASLQPTVASPASGASSTPIVPTIGITVGDPKQENINRQSSINQAINLISAALSAGYNVVPGDSSKAKKAAKDPEVLFEWVMYTARRIKHEVQQGIWDVVEFKGEAEPTTADELNDDIPF